MRLLLAVLAFVGSQAAFVSASFAPAPRAVPLTAWEHGGSTQAQPVIDAARLPMRGGRRAAPTVGPSDPAGADVPVSAIVIRPTGRAAASLEPLSFVPPPPFHPPRVR